jgi:chromosome segregation ATPase
VSRVHDSVKSSVTVDLELDRARRETEQITPEVRKNMHVIASEEVRIEQLEKRIKALEKKLSQDQTHILRLKVDLESGTSNFHYSGVSFTAKEVKRDLVNRFDEFTTDEETCKSLVKLLQARNNSLHTAQERLAKMQSSQRKLNVEIDNLEARNKMVQVAQASSENTFDDSQLSRTRELVDSINSRIRTDEKLLNVESRPLDRIPLENADEEIDIFDRISSHFDNPVEMEIGLASTE